MYSLTPSSSCLCNSLLLASRPSFPRDKLKDVCFSSSNPKVAQETFFFSRTPFAWLTKQWRERRGCVPPDGVEALPRDSGQVCNHHNRQPTQLWTHLPFLCVLVAAAALTPRAGEWQARHRGRPSDRRTRQRRAGAARAECGIFSLPLHSSSPHTPLFPCCRCLVTGHTPKIHKHTDLDAHKKLFPPSTLISLFLSALLNFMTVFPSCGTTDRPDPTRPNPTRDCTPWGS